jgi:AAA+ ATPase superfamily predicted ATPase
VLHTALWSPRSELLILYGRRGVGKSALLEHVLAEDEAPYLFYRATRRTLPLQLAALTEAAREAYPGAFLAQPFASTQVFLEFLAHMAEQRETAGQRMVAVVDEMPYLAEVDEGFLTALQHWWDQQKRRPNLKILLVGSTLSFMERQVLDVAAPLYNRRTGALKLEPLDYAEAGLFFPNYTSEEKMVSYAILGGMPAYLEQFEPGRSIEENVKATALRRNTYLSEEPEWLLLGELRRDITYASILRAVASGARRPSDIARAIGKDSAQDVAPQLVTLRQMGLLFREVPVTERSQPRSRNSLYWVADHYLDFWYRYVDPARSLVARGLGERLWERSIAPTLGECVSRPAFERACREYLWRALAGGLLPADLTFAEVGSWWGAGSLEIDVLATGERGQVALAGSCKWTGDPVDVREYAALQETLTLSRQETEAPYMALFSRSGFTERLRRIAAVQQPPRLLLIDVGIMYRV